MWNCQLCILLCLTSFAPTLWDLSIVCVTVILCHIVIPRINISWFISSILILMDIWVCGLELLQAMLQWIYGLILIRHMYLGVESCNIELCVCLTYMGNAKLFAKTVLTSIPSNQYCTSVAIVPVFFRSGYADLTSHKDCLCLYRISWYWQIFIYFLFLFIVLVLSDFYFYLFGTVRLFFLLNHFLMSVYF